MVYMRICSVYTLVYARLLAAPHPKKNPFDTFYSPSQKELVNIWYEKSLLLNKHLYALVACFLETATTKKKQMQILMYALSACLTAFAFALSRVVILRHLCIFWTSLFRAAHHAYISLKRLRKLRSINALPLSFTINKIAKISFDVWLGVYIFGCKFGWSREHTPIESKPNN